MLKRTSFCFVLGLALLVVASGPPAQAADTPTGMLSMEVKDRKETISIFVDDRAKALPVPFVGPFIQLRDGGILTVTGDDVQISTDQGMTWSAKRQPTAVDGKVFKRDKGAAALLRTRDGTLLWAFANEAELVRTGPLTSSQAENARMPLYIQRSLDDGNTWERPQLVLGGFTGNTRSIIQLRSGRIVAAVPHVTFERPSRWRSVCVISDDDGRTWQTGQVIDPKFAWPNGAGDLHDGARAGTMAELEDGRLWMLLAHRRPCETYSIDGGLTWADAQEVKSAYSTSQHATLVRLQSGRLARLWVELGAERTKEEPNAGARLCLAFTADEGKTWSPTATLVHRTGTPNMKEAGRCVHSAEVFEAAPGELWVTLHRPDVRLRLFERDIGNVA